MRGFLFLVVCTWLSCGQEPTLCTSYYSQDKLKYEVPCKDGLFHGTYREYNRAGNLWVVKHYVDGVVEDTTRYYYARSGELLKEVAMLHDKKQGQSVEYAEDGSRKRVQHFEQDRRVGEELTYHPDGKTIEELKTYRDHQLNGPYRRQDETGQVLLEGTYQAGEPAGTWVHFYPDGNPKAHFTFEAGEKAGPFDVLRPNGQPFVKGKYRRGKVDGLISYFNAAGQPVYEERWKLGTNLDHDQGSGLDREYDVNQGGFYDASQHFRIKVSQQTVTIEAGN
jgi:antitoxin component YwqK of YwqJK toxin-antitoxin module